MVENIKYLGVIVDKHLSWDEQISAVTKKVSCGLGMLCFSEKYLPIITVQKMYKSLVEPYFRYSCPVWEIAVSMLSIGCKNSKIGRQESSQIVFMLLLLYP